MKIVPDNYLYAKVNLYNNLLEYSHSWKFAAYTFISSVQVARFIGSRKDLTEDKLEELEELVMDTTKAQAIFEAARVSMGEQIVCTMKQRERECYMKLQGGS